MQREGAILHRLGIPMGDSHMDGVDPQEGAAAPEGLVVQGLSSRTEKVCIHGLRGKIMEGAVGAIRGKKTMVMGLVMIEQKGPQLVSLVGVEEGAGMEGAQAATKR
jgi:hypothetical protein